MQYIPFIYLLSGLAFGLVCYVDKHKMTLHREGTIISVKSILHSIFTDPIAYRHYLKQLEIHYDEDLRPAKPWVFITLVTWIVTPMVTWPLGLYLRRKFDMSFDALTLGDTK
tara:strand:- start:1482 stop:1817 length:336 start_codon:yes stop_codon:yes gene_type:complete